MKKLIVPFLIVAAWGCSFQQTESIPEQLQELENITVYSADTIPSETVFFKKDVVYSESDEVLIGRMGDMTVDRWGRVFIADVRKSIIHAFEPDGRYIAPLGREGRGPGEFSSFPKNLQIHGNRLYAFDPTPNRLNVFTLDSLVSEIEVSLAEDRYRYQALARAFPEIRNLFVRRDGTYIAEFIKHASHESPPRYQNIKLTSLFYLLDSDGIILRELHEFTSEIRTNVGLVFHFKDFFGNVLPGFTSDDQMYLADPDHFLVKTYSSDGDYLHAFFYSLRKIPLTRESAIEAGISDRNIDEMGLLDLPEFWPVLTDMVIDDQDRLWIAVTVEDMNIYEWWVLEETGEVITRFEWPRDESIEVVKNGYMYTRETDEETDLQQVARYRIELEEV